jgi:hypothetical protein
VVYLIKVIDLVHMKLSNDSNKPKGSVKKALFTAEEFQEMIETLDKIIAEKNKRTSV